MTGRIGFARFQFMNFLTYGVEAGYQLSDNFAVIGGLEAYSTRRNIPPELLTDGLPPVQWNTLIPIHVNAMYRPREGDLKPFVGAGIQLIPAYVKDAQTVAFGARAIGGMDKQLSDNFGINLTAYAGFWAGTEWYRIQGLMNTGFTAQISAGSVLSF
jgi:outer membrane protein W